MSSDDELITFCRKIKEEIKTNSITPEKKIMLIELYLKMELKDKEDAEKIKLEDEDIIKYLVMGWYVYEHLKS